MKFETVILETDGPVAAITLNRPEKYNTFNGALRRDLLAAVRAVNDDPTVRIVIVKGAGRGFSTGADLSSGEPVEDPVSDVLNHEFKPIMEEIFLGPKLFIAQVHGPAAGVSAALAMACDLMVMEEGAYLYQAFHAIALVPDGGNCWFLLQQAGYRRALEMVLEGPKVSAAECRQLGLCNHVVAADDLDQFTKDWARRLAGKAPLAVAASKRLLRNMGQTSLGTAISMEAREQTLLMRSQDFKRGVQAFFEKKAPDFKGN
ncbi:MAG: enoyl-CoA hydratase-related protein [Rhodobacteraceae bacterium]|nr:enoyl-CoA hydratase-related protein [Paracoccaceae bacterium]